MSDFSTMRKVLHIRNRKTCFLCGRSFPQGSPMFDWKGRFEGTFFSSKICEACEKILGYQLDHGDGYDQNAVVEYMGIYGVNTPEELLQKLDHKGGPNHDC